MISKIFFVENEKLHNKWQKKIFFDNFLKNSLVYSIPYLNNNKVGEGGILRQERAKKPKNCISPC